MNLKSFMMGNSNGSRVMLMSLVMAIIYVFRRNQTNEIFCNLPKQQFGKISIGERRLVCGIGKCQYSESFCKAPIVEKHVIKPLVILSHLLNPRAIFDIGSNIGIFSAYAADLAPIVYSYDVQTELNELVSRSSQLYPNIRVMNCGLGVRPETGWTPDGFVKATGGICDLDKVNFDNTLIKLDVDGNEEDIVNKALATSFGAMILEVTPSGWKKEPTLLKKFCDQRLCFLTETDKSEALHNLITTHRSGLLNYIDSPIINSTVINFLFERRLVHNLIIIGGIGMSV